jgi:hypothetical protein
VGLGTVTRGDLSVMETDVCPGDCPLQAPPQALAPDPSRRTPHAFVAATKIPVVIKSSSLSA